MQGNQRGATAVEYGLIVALCVLAVAGGLELLGDLLGIMYGQQVENLSNLSD